MYIACGIGHYISCFNRSQIINVGFFLVFWFNTHLTYLQWPFNVNLFLTVDVLGHVARGELSKKVWPWKVTLNRSNKHRPTFQEKSDIYNLWSVFYECIFGISHIMSWPQRICCNFDWVVWEQCIGEQRCPAPSYTMTLLILQVWDYKLKGNKSYYLYFSIDIYRNDQCLDYWLTGVKFTICLYIYS